MAMMTIRASQIAEVTKLSIGVYTPAFHSSQMNHWLELVYKDVILVCADVGPSLFSSVLSLT